MARKGPIETEHVMPDRRRILVVQYAGDYREAYYRLQQSGAETYRAQRYTVEAVEQIGQRFGEAATLIYQTAEKYEEVLPNGVAVFGMGIQGHPSDYGEILGRIEAWQPTHLIQRCITPEVLDWVARRPIHGLAMLAEMSPAGGLRNWLRNRRLARILNRPRIEWVGNHHLSATRWLQEIGVRDDKLIPYDYEYAQAPDSFEPKSLNQAGPWALGYVGAVADGKGVPDLIDAAAVLIKAALPVRLRIAGTGEIDKFRQQAKRLGIEASLDFVGAIPNDQVIDFMRSVDVVVVPSRHEYSESFGFVVQEAFVSRSPLIASDHRAFQGRVIERETGLIFPSRNTAVLAERIKQVLTDPALYHRLSINSASAWVQMQIPVKWADLIYHWLEDSETSRRWLWNHRLASGRYA